MYEIVFVNTLSLIRIPLSVLFCILVVDDVRKLVLLTSVFALIILTDFLDGRLARKFHVESNLGAALDTFADLFFMLSAGSTLYFKHIFPMEILILMFVKYTEFFITSWIHYARRKSERFFLYDKLGKTVAVSYYTLPIILIIWNRFIPNIVNSSLVKGLFIVLLLFSLASSISRIKKACF